MELHDRVYPEFLTHTQANARWSIVRPALQQLPGDLSDIFVPDEGYAWLKHDWSAIEMRLQGAIANDVPLLRAFGSSLEWACQNVYEELWGDYERRWADCIGVQRVSAGVPRIPLSSSDGEVLQSFVSQLKAGVLQPVQERLNRVPSASSEWSPVLSPSGQGGWAWNDRTSHQWEQGRQSARELRGDDARGALLAACATWVVTGGPPPLWEGKHQLNGLPTEWDTHTVNMCEVLEYKLPVSKYDPHYSVADEGWRETLQWRGKDDLRRRFAKVFCFRLLYRGDPRFAGDIPGARQLGLDGKKLQRAADAWLVPHHAIRTYWARIDEQIKRYGFTQTWTGRKRRYTSIGPDKVIPLGVFREGANHPIQGGVSDLKNLTMIELLERCEWLTLAKEQHDAFWLECPLDRVDETWPIYQEVVQRPRVIEGVTVPFPAEFKLYLPDGSVQKVARV